MATDRVSFIFPEEIGAPISADEMKCVGLEGVTTIACAVSDNKAIAWF